MEEKRSPSTPNFLALRGDYCTISQFIFNHQESIANTPVPIEASACKKFDLSVIYMWTLS
jgi:hypothetical protein